MPLSLSLSLVFKVGARQHPCERNTVTASALCART